MMRLTAAGGWSWVQARALSDAQTGEFFGGGRVNAHGVQQYFNGQTGSGNVWVEHKFVKKFYSESKTYVEEKDTHLTAAANPWITSPATGPM